jgi:4-amino-4-deoxy-L-arabinose transferase-like glycosyltransferase
MDQGTKWNTEQGNMPSIADLHAARRTSVFVAGLTVVALFVIGTRLTNRVGGVFTALIYALHPLVLATSSRALSDPLLVLCIALAAVAAIRFVARPTWGRAALVGLLLGLGGATKLSPLGVAIGLGVLGLVLVGSALLWRGESAPRLRQIGIRLLAVPVVALLVFVAVYPYLWTDPIDHTQRMLDFRTESFRLQAGVSPDAKLSNRTAAFRRAGAELGVRMSTGGVIAEKLESRFDFGDWIWLRDLDLMLAVAGWILLIALAVRRGWSHPAMIIAVVIGGQALFIILSMSIFYLRYLLPVLLAVAIGAGVACGVLWAALTRLKSPGAEGPRGYPGYDLTKPFQG